MQTVDRSNPFIEKMRIVFGVVLLCAAACAQFGGFFGRFGRQQNRFQGVRAPVDNSFGGSDYHYSWRHAGFNVVWPYGGAFSYCLGLGSGWRPVSINSFSEDQLVRNAVGRDQVRYIWTGGQRAGRGWSWADGSSLGYTGWSRTGGSGRPQPDNREGREDCLAVLNNFYPNDGITWHDIGCHHQKPVICERG